MDRLLAITSLPALISFLRDELDWPINEDDLEDAFFDYTPEEVGLDSAQAAAVRSLRQIRPLVPNQPWGIFCVEFEPKRLPVVVLRRLLTALVPKRRASAQHPGHAVWNPDDLLFIVASGELGERGITFAHFQAFANGSMQLRTFSWDETERHFYYLRNVNLERLRWPAEPSDDAAWRDGWRSAFPTEYRGVIRTSRELSVALAVVASRTRSSIEALYGYETATGPLHRLCAAFRATLIHDLDVPEFADLVAQTISYGLFSARATGQEVLGLEHLESLIPATNPLLRELLGALIKADRSAPANLDLDELGVVDLVSLLNRADLDAVLMDFGRQTRGGHEDPVIHFYESFLREYDPQQKIKRGVFYTPLPVVSYIVRSVDELVRTEFGLEDGLADTTTWGAMAKRHSELKIPEGVPSEQAFIQILDPATGTGTFLVEVIDLIHATMLAKWKAQGNGEKKIEALWNEYVPKHLLPRLHGYEILMAPYAIAHLKIGLKLHETGYRFDSDERARIYLTNSLEPASDVGQQVLEGFLPALAHEAQAVNEVKRNQRFTVLIGNPPYSNFGRLNRIPFILRLLDDYKRGLNERKLNLDDDFIKFIRFSQWVLANSDVGVLGLISNNTYLDGITHRHMRRSLADCFTTIDVLDLHGSLVKAERGPAGDKEENVFDIRQGVAIGLFVRPVESAAPRIRHSELWGTRERKYAWLASQSVQSTSWHRVGSSSPGYFFVPKKFGGRTEYRGFVSMPELMPRGTSAIQTKRDALFVDFDRGALAERMREILENGATDEMLERYTLEKSAGWSPECLSGVAFDAGKIRQYLYRPFDRRFIYYDDALLGRSRIAVFRHLLSPNVALATLRQTVDDAYRHVFCTTQLCDINLTIGHHVSDRVFPLYIYADAQQGLLGRKRTENVSPAISRRLASTMGLDWRGDGKGDLLLSVGPEDVFQYIYAILHSPAYRTRYVDFLKIDFPRVPLPGSLDLFRPLAHLGGDLVALHLMDSPELDELLTTYTGPKNPEVGRVGWSDDTVWLDAAATTKGQLAKSGTVGFRGVPEAVWNFRIGGYQVCEKWLKDRKGRTLSEDDLAHYQKIVVALHETIRRMKEIDEVIEQHGGWPGAFAPETDNEPLSLPH